MAVFRFVVTVIHGFFGFIAQINEKLFRYRLNGTPCTYFAIYLMVIPFFGCVALLPQTVNDVPTFLRAVIAGFGMILFFTAQIAFVVTRITRFIVFQRQVPTNLPAFDGSLPTLDGLRVSGRFVLGNQQAIRRFRNVPSLLACAPRREPVFLASVNASEKWMGFTTNELRGLWAIALKSFDPNTVQFGFFYEGFCARPALRFSYVDGITGKTEKLVLRFADEIERAAGVEWLQSWETYRHGAMSIGWLNTGGFAPFPPETQTASAVLPDGVGSSSG